jgi:hypothetical protein
MMRCGRASLVALLAHPKYSRDTELISQATILADALIKKSSYAMISDLPPFLAARIIKPHIPRILKQQRSNGLWKIKDAQRISFEILSALNNAGLLPDLVQTEAFRHNPFQAYLDRSDLYGWATRNSFLCTPLPSDGILRDKLSAETLAVQWDDGSWEGTIVATCKMIRRLMLLGDRDNKAIKEAASWLLSTYNQDVEGHGPKGSYGVPAHHMFLTHNRGTEFRSAQKQRPEWDPKQLCYNHLGMIQNGITIHTLIRLGYHDDIRVTAACDNLYSLRERYGGWCQTNIRDPFIAETKRSHC